jgi:hypothetical protein
MPKRDPWVKPTPQPHSTSKQEYYNGFPVFRDPVTNRRYQRMSDLGKGGRDRVYLDYPTPDGGGASPSPAPSEPVHINGTISGGGLIYAHLKVVVGDNPDIYLNMLGVYLGGMDCSCTLYRYCSSWSAYYQAESFAWFAAAPDPPEFYGHEFEPAVWSDAESCGVLYNADHNALGYIQPHVAGDIGIAGGWVSFSGPYNKPSSPAWFINLPGAVDKAVLASDLKSRCTKPGKYFSLHQPLPDPAGPHTHHYHGML